jgi:hypothetical protein
VMLKRSFRTAARHPDEGRCNPVGALCPSCRDGAQRPFIAKQNICADGAALFTVATHPQLRTCSLLPACGDLNSLNAGHLVACQVPAECPGVLASLTHGRDPDDRKNVQIFGQKPVQRRLGERFLMGAG